MESKVFIENIRKNLINSNMESYQTLFDMKLSDIKDESWKQNVQLFNTLSTDQKDIFFSIIHQIQVDTVSNLLGIIDGTSYLSEDNEDFELITLSDGNVINGDLQDLFLEIEEK